jgi:hypothetical protein
LALVELLRRAILDRRNMQDMKNGVADTPFFFMSLMFLLSKNSPASQSC